MVDNGSLPCMCECPLQHEREPPQRARVLIRDKVTRARKHSRVLTRPGRAAGAVKAAADATAARAAAERSIVRLAGIAHKKRCNKS